MTIKLGVPSKGRLMEKTFDWFGQHGIKLRRDGSDREYSGAVDGIDGVELVLLSAGEVPRELAMGRIHLGVTGSDLVSEKLGQSGKIVGQVVKLGLGHADLVVAVPTSWVDVETLDDLDAAAAAFRKAHGFRLRVATKYHRLTREFFTKHGVAEGTVKNLLAEAIADITSTGETMKANHLKILGDGLIHCSQATLFESHVADWSDEQLAAKEVLIRKIGAKNA